MVTSAQFSEQGSASNSRRETHVYKMRNKNNNAEHIWKKKQTYVVYKQYVNTSYSETENNNNNLKQ